MLPPDIRAQLDEILSDPLSFIRLLHISDKASGKRIRFEPNGEQKRLIREVQKSKRVIVLKPRQIGISTVLRAYALWRTYTTKDPLRFGVISFHDRSAKHLRRMDSRLLSSLPKLLSRKLSVDNATSLEFEDTEAAMSSYTAGSKGGTRSFTLSAAHLSEFAFYENPEELLAQVVATVGDGAIFIESTPNVPGDAFHRLVMGAPENGWKLITFWWHQHLKYRQDAPKKFVRTEEEEKLSIRFALDDDQLYWRRQQVATLGLDKFRREYPGCMEDAFYHASTTYFQSEDLEYIQEIFFDGKERKYSDPDPTDIYAIGVDVAAGVGSDYSTITVVSMATYQPVYHFRSNEITPTAFSDKVLTIAQRYNDAKVLCESNNHGHVVLYRLRHNGYRNLWCGRKGVDWVTSVKSKLDAYETLREYVGNNMIVRLDAQVLSELRALTVERVTPEAPKGMHDDLAMSMALAYRCLRDIPRRKLQMAKRNLMDTLISKVRCGKIKESNLPWKVNE